MIIQRTVIVDQAGSPETEVPTTDASLPKVFTDSRSRTRAAAENVWADLNRSYTRPTRVHT